MINLTEKMKKIDEYFSNVTDEQFDKDLIAIGIDEYIKYVEQETENIERELYFCNSNQYVYSKDINYDILCKEGTRCQRKLKKQEKQSQELALAS